jgi:hypothetical protein
MADQRRNGEAMSRPRLGCRDVAHRLRGWHLVRGGLLLGFSALIAKLFIAGEMVRYMAPTLDPLTALTCVAMGVMGVMEIAAGPRRPLATSTRGTRSSKSSPASS